MFTHDLSWVVGGNNSHDQRDTIHMKSSSASGRESGSASDSEYDGGFGMSYSMTYNIYLFRIQFPVSFDSTLPELLFFLAQRTHLFSISTMYLKRV